MSNFSSSGILFILLLFVSCGTPKGFYYAKEEKLLIQEELKEGRVVSIMYPYLASSYEYEQFYWEYIEELFQDHGPSFYWNGTAPNN